MFKNNVNSELKTSQKGKMKCKTFLKSAIGIIAGIAILGIGLSFSGISLPLFGHNGQNVKEYAHIEGNIQTVFINVEPKSYKKIVVQKGIPVQFTLRADSSNLSSCNSTVVIPEFNIEKELQPGDNIIEFFPQKAGTIPYSCKMGMVKSKIFVIDDITKNEK